MRRAALGLLALTAACRPGAAPDAASAAAPTTGAVGAATALVAATPAGQRAELARPLADTVRTTWFFVPIARPGIPLGAMSDAQRAATESLVRTGLSDAGWRRAQSIIAHEPILRALEQAAGVPGFERRDSARYYTLLFGTPAPDSLWGWRFEGHHLSVSATAVGNATPAVAPLFMGANPARVPSGPHAGLRLFAAEEDQARALLLALGDAHRRAATISDTTYGEIVTRNDPAVRPLPTQGLAAADMPEPQRRQLRALLELYAARMTPAAARAQLARIDSAGFGALRFAWAGSAEPGKKHYYRIHGPTVLVEYDNSQNNANHVHTVWRDLQNDFGRDLLRAHYAKHRHDR